MGRTKRIACIILCGVVSPAVGNADQPKESVPFSSAEDASGAYPLDYFAMRPVVRSVSLSPDGKYLALMKIPSKDGNPVVEVYEATDLAKEPFRMNADPMEITGLRWVSDADIVFDLRQQVRDRIEGFNRGTFEFKLGLLNMETKKLKSFDEGGIFVEHGLPQKPRAIIISMQEGDVDGRLDRAFRPRSYWELDLTRGSKQLLIRGKISLGQIEFDGEGNPWLARGFDEGSDEFVWYHRKLGERGWNDILRHSEDSFEDFGVVGFDVDDRDKLFVIAHRGNDTRGLWTYDIETGHYEAVYRRSDVDVLGVVGHSNRLQHPDRVVGLVYYKDKYHYEFFDDGDDETLSIDELEGATREQLAGVVPHAYEVRISSRSRDGNTLVVYNFGPKDPGTYYLLKDGRFSAVGSQQPLFKSEDLADVEYITYKARDGLTIPAWVTVPHGEPPFPLVVMPHGGPFVRETVAYHKWAQMLANNGYLVLQPQYRGSLNYGREFYQRAFADVSQGGGAMQDDKDDGALHLIAEGLADKDRVAKFGWSYGGYAALVAASRTPQLYQCVIAGAAVTDPTMQVNYLRFRMRGAPSEQWIDFWDKAVSPLKEVEKVNVPMLIVHGDVDQRVPIEHAKKYLELLDEHDKPYQYLELAGADHFSDTLFYGHQETLYGRMVDYLANDCGPEGL